MTTTAVASCVDWYGNARPIFLGDRMFALLGYELVEGRRAGRSCRGSRAGEFLPTLDGRLRLSNTAF